MNLYILDEFVTDDNIFEKQKVFIQTHCFLDRMEIMSLSCGLQTTQPTYSEVVTVVKN